MLCAHNTLQCGVVAWLGLWGHRHRHSVALQPSFTVIWLIPTFTSKIGLCWGSEDILFKWFTHTQTPNKRRIYSNKHLLQVLSLQLHSAQLQISWIFFSGCFILITYGGTVWKCLHCPILNKSLLKLNLRYMKLNLPYWISPWQKWNRNSDFSPLKQQFVRKKNNEGKQSHTESTKIARWPVKILIFVVLGKFCPLALPCPLLQNKTAIVTSHTAYAYEDWLRSRESTFCSMGKSHVVCNSAFYKWISQWCNTKSAAHERKQFIIHRNQSW